MDHETQSSYQTAGFGQSDQRGERPVVLVVDMCRAYFEPESPLFLDRPEVIESCRALVDAARQAGVPVVWTRVEFEPDDESVWYRRISVLTAFDRGNPLADWVDGLVPTPDELVVTKRHASAFAGTDLAERLAQIGADSLLVCGVSTSGCVRASATDASAHDLIPLVVREAVGDRTDAVHEANLFDLNAKYADVVGIDDVVQGLVGLS